MSELIFFKTFKFLITCITWGGVAIIGLDQVLDNKLVEVFHVSKSTQLIVTWMVISLLGVKIIWFIVDKYLEWKERVQKMKNEKVVGK